MKNCRLFLSLLCITGICYGKNATLVLVKDAVNQGAVCLDGSAPGYYIRRGSGDGASKWILHLEGGGWCGDERECLDRSKTALGSSTFWAPSGEFHGFLSDDATVNPDFYDWSIVYLMYCDGSSFSSNRVDPVDVLDSKIYMRGKLVLDALLNNLLMDNGLQDASEVILTGCSAGGLATFIHADYVGAYLPQNIKYRAFADAGFFLDIPDIYGTMAGRRNTTYGVYMQNVTGALNQECLKMYNCLDEWKCFFAPYTFSFVKTPMFVGNSLYDTAQLAGLGLGCLPPHCPEDKMKFFYNFRTQFLEQLAPALASETAGVFADSCLVHCQTLTDDTWTQYRVGSQSMRDTFANWYFGRSSGKKKEVDCVFPCNPTCPVSLDPDTQNSNPLEDGFPFF